MSQMSSAAARNLSSFNEQGESISDVLSRVRDELDQIASSIDNMQAVVGELTWDLARQDPEYLKAMQSVDHSAQVVAGLGDFLVALAKDAPSDWKLNPAAASKIVRLADLAARLATSSSLPKNAESDGNCDFF